MNKISASAVILV